MTATYRKVSEIAELLYQSHLSHTKRLKFKCIYLTRAQFNKAADRDKVEDTVYTKVAQLLRRKGLHLLRFQQTYVLVSKESFTTWPTPTELDLKAWGGVKPKPLTATQSTGPKARPKSTAAERKAGLAPAAAWPFPTGKKP